MRILSTVGLLVLATPLGSCSGCSGHPHAQTSALAPEQGRPVLAVSATPTGEDQAGYDAPPHVFIARNHGPRQHLFATPVDVQSLPRLVNRVGSCFEQERPQIAAPFPRSKPVPRSAKRAASRPSVGLGGIGSGVIEGVGSGFGRGSDGAMNERSAAAPKPPLASTPAEQSEAARRPVDSPRQAVKSEDLASEALDDSELPQLARPEPAPEAGYHDWGSKTYLSNDDTMSLSSAQRVSWAIDHFQPLPAEHIRPHELLNYFSFDAKEVAPENDFSVHASLQAKPGEDSIYTLGLSVSGRTVSTEQRRNAALTFVIDRSGSMSAEGRMSFLKRGLLRMTKELKTGDLVNLVYFDQSVCTPLQNFVVGRDPMSVLEQAIERLHPRGATDLHAGLKRGYELADRSYQNAFGNRVVMITDAMTNTGQTDEELISMISTHYDKRRIRLSGVGVGADFNDALLDRLTERGKGAYVFLGSEAEVDAVFGARFTSLIETIANDVHFQLHLPPSLRMNVFYGEESSTVKEEVQAVHYFAGTGQLFLSDLMARGGALRPQDSVMLTVEYEHPETGKASLEEFAFNLGEIAKDARNVKKGRLIMSFIDGLKDIAMSSPERSDYRRGGWLDAHAFKQCALGKESLRRQAAALAQDREVERVLSLWDKFCSRYERPREPVRRPAPRGKDVWPGATE